MNDIIDRSTIKGYPDRDRLQFEFIQPGLGNTMISPAINITSITYGEKGFEVKVNPSDVSKYITNIEDFQKLASNPDNKEYDTRTTAIFNKNSEPLIQLTNVIVDKPYEISETVIILANIDKIKDAISKLHTYLSTKKNLSAITGSGSTYYDSIESDFGKKMQLIDALQPTQITDYKKKIKNYTDWIKSLNEKNSIEAYKNNIKYFDKPPDKTQINKTSVQNDINADFRNKIILNDQIISGTGSYTINLKNLSDFLESYILALPDSRKNQKGFLKTTSNIIKESINPDNEISKKTDLDYDANALSQLKITTGGSNKKSSKLRKIPRRRFTRARRRITM